MRLDRPWPTGLVGKFRCFRSFVAMVPALVQRNSILDLSVNLFAADGNATLEGVPAATEEPSMTQGDSCVQ